MGNGNSADERDKLLEVVRRLHMFLWETRQSRDIIPHVHIE